MFESLVKMPHVTRRLKKVKKFKKLLDKCAEYLISNRYSHGYIGHYQRSLEHFIYWVENNKLKCQINSLLVNKFISEHIPICQCPRPHPRGIRDLRPALALLLKIYEVEFSKHTQSEKLVSKIDLLIKEFDSYLLHMCGLSIRTRAYHRRNAKTLLKYYFKSKKIDLNKLTPIKVRDFLYKKLKVYKRRTVGLFIYSLRTFFKFLKFKNIGGNNLIESLPKIIEWKSAALPEYLNKTDLSKLLGAIDQDSSLGKRDYAMIICMLELGLRASEVANLSLNDIDWRNQILYLPLGKTRQSNSLPMTPLVVSSIIKYLKYGRPKSKSRQVFVYHKAPVGKGIIPSVPRNMVRKYLLRAKLNPMKLGSHILRRTFATNLLNKGATIKEIADLLRHRSICITSIYTKVDFQKLSQVSLPWPEELV